MSSSRVSTRGPAFPRSKIVNKRDLLLPTKNGFDSKGTETVDDKSKNVTTFADDLLARDRDDPLCATEYVEDMYASFRDTEATTLPDLNHQPHITYKMRAILVDWIIAVHRGCRLSPETLYLTVQIVDRFLEINIISLNKFQSVGTAALLIASKYEDIYFPSLKELVEYTQGTVRAEDILSMETTILKALNYQISKPTAHMFLIRYTRAAHADKEIVQSASYIAEGTLLDGELSSTFLPSQLAAASVYIARRGASGRSDWSATLSKYTSYSKEDIKPVARAILLARASRYTGLTHLESKYTSNFGAVVKNKFSSDF